LSASAARAAPGISIEAATIAANARREILVIVGTPCGENIKNLGRQPIQPGQRQCRSFGLRKTPLYSKQL